MTELDDENALKLMSSEDFDYQKMVSNIMKPNINNIEIKRVVLRDEQGQGQKVEVPIDVYETILHPISQQNINEYKPVLDFAFDLQERYQERFPE